MDTRIASMVKPILFSGPMVRAILDERKTQTRRVVKPQTCYKENPRPRCPYGHPGDLIWVRETWADVNSYEGPAICYRADGNHINGAPEHRWKPSIFMPRWASRLTLKITDVRIEQVQDINREDAIAEGCDNPLKGSELLGISGDYVADERTSFAQLWNSINAKRGYSWQSNPWVWVVEFKAIHNNVDKVLYWEAK